MSRPEDLATEVDEQAPKDHASFAIRVIEGPADVGTSVDVDASAPSAILVGKSPACQLILHDPRVSRRHLALDLAGAHLRAQDLGSTNGTTVNGVRVNDALLAGGETIVIGGTTLRVERRSSQTSTVAPSGASFGRMVGASSAMRRLYPLCERLAASMIPVVIEGEAGTGKELLAEQLHEQGPRKGGPFIVFDCTTIAPHAVPAALFGEEVGGQASRGAFEQAEGGTLLIDEVTELSAPVQGRLLRALERGEVTHIGSEKPIPIDVRVIATTRRDLDKEVEAGRFREDLYFRLTGARVELPPLRRRLGDDKLLASYFTTQLRGEGHKLPPDFLRRYESYGWPGNVRELHNAVARRLALGDTLIDEELEEETITSEEPPDAAFRWLLEQDLPFTNARDLIQSAFERAYVDRVLAQHHGNVSHAAEASGLARRYFQIIRARGRK